MSDALPTDPAPSPPGPHLDTLALHQLRLGELDPAAAAVARAHVEACARCRARLGAQEAHRRAFELSPVPPALRATVRPTPVVRLAGWVRGRTPLLGALAAAAALLVLVLRPPPAPLDAVRSKGDGQVELLREGEGLMESGASVQPGDRIQVRVPAGPYAEAWVGDADAVLGHFPLSPDRATLAPFALTIDEEPGAEALTVILSEAPLARDEAEGLLRRHGARGSPPLGVKIQRMYLPKEARR